MRCLKRIVFQQLNTIILTSILITDKNCFVVIVFFFFFKAKILTETCGFIIIVIFFFSEEKITIVVWRKYQISRHRAGTSLSKVSDDFFIDSIARKLSRFFFVFLRLQRFIVAFGTRTRKNYRSFILYRRDFLPTIGTTVRIVIFFFYNIRPISFRIK